MKNDYRERRAKDEQDEKIVGEFLDTYFYPTFCTTITRNTNKETQIKGLDLTVTGFNGVKYTIDEKAATRWAGRNLQTFAHEINSVNVSGHTYDGWLLDFQSASDYLVEVWIDELSSIDNKLHSKEDIKDCTITLIPKKSLYEYLKKNGVQSSTLREYGNMLRQYNKPSTYYGKFKITCQTYQQEQAANILIPRDTLINTIGCYSVQIKKGKITKLK